MKRWEIINEFIKKYNYKDYLEIGLDSGRCRDRVIAENKTTVDPSKKSNNPTHLMTSDEFFDQNKDKFDIIFIDGLHEAHQVYNDIINSLDCLRDGGTILCHDMLPSSEIIQRVPRENAIWTGDCWKSFFRLRATRKDLEMFVVESDWGVGVIRKGSQEIYPEFDIDFSKMDWEMFTQNRKVMNTVSVTKFMEIVKG